MLHKFDIAFLSETYLDSIIPNDDEKLQITGYILIRSEHRSNTKRGGVCIYYKRSLPLRVINIGYLHYCLSFEIQIGDKICNFVARSRSSSQSQDDFENMVIESGIHSSHHSSCHHQIVFAKFNLKICYPSPHSREVWHFK